MKKLVLPNNPILRQHAEAVTKEMLDNHLVDATLREMYTIAYGRRKKASKPLLVGLAAPQIGKSQRIILVDTGANGKGQLSHLEVFINPEITQYSREKNNWYEGCWSTSRVCGIVTRPSTIKIKAYNLEFSVVEKEFNGYVARIFQHEIDHLNGILFPDKISDASHLHWVEEREFPEYRNNQAWRNWKKLCTFDQWRAIST